MIVKKKFKVMLITMRPWVWYNVCTWYVCTDTYRHAHSHFDYMTNTGSRCNPDEFQGRFSGRYIMPHGHPAPSELPPAELTNMSIMSQKRIKGLQMSSKTCCFPFIMHVIFTIVMFDSISLIHLPVLGPSTFFQVREMICLAWNIYISTNLDLTM